MKNSNLSSIANVLTQSILKRDTRSIYKLLLDVIESDYISILIYSPKTSLLYQVDIDESINTDILDKSSILGRAFLEHQIKLYNHIASDKYYRPDIDNPYQTRLKSQIIVPVLDSDTLVGIIRFSKSVANRGSYTHLHLDSIKTLMPILTQVIYSFQPEKYAKLKAENQESINSINTKEEIVGVENAIQKIQSLLGYIAQNSEDRDINRLLIESERSIQKIHEVYFDKYITKNIDKQQKFFKEKDRPIYIMIADDVKLNRAILEAMIKDREHIICVAGDGDIALEKMEKLHSNGSSIEILFLDHHMPNMLGSEVVKTINSNPNKYTNNDTLSIVSITNDPDAINDYREAYNYHIRKPFLKDEIQAIMRIIKSKEKNV